MVCHNTIMNVILTSIRVRFPRVTFFLYDISITATFMLLRTCHMTMFQMNNNIITKDLLENNRGDFAISEMFLWTKQKR